MVQYEFEGWKPNQYKFTYSHRLGSSTSLSSLLSPHLSLTCTSVNNKKDQNLRPANRKGTQYEIHTFRLRSGPFQHLSPFENCITRYDSSNLSQRLMAEKFISWHKDVMREKDQPTNYVACKEGLFFTFQNIMHCIFLNTNTVTLDLKLSYVFRRILICKFILVKKLRVWNNENVFPRESITNQVHSLSEGTQQRAT